MVMVRQPSRVVKRMTPQFIVGCEIELNDGSQVLMKIQSNSDVSYETFSSLVWEAIESSIGIEKMESCPSDYVLQVTGPDIESPIKLIKDLPIRSQLPSKPCSLLVKLGSDYNTRLLLIEEEATDRRDIIIDSSNAVASCLKISYDHKLVAISNIKLREGIEHRNVIFEEMVLRGLLSEAQLINDTNQCVKKLSKLKSDFDECERLRESDVKMATFSKKRLLQLAAISFSAAHAAANSHHVGIAAAKLFESPKVNKNITYSPVAEISRWDYQEITEQAKTRNTIIAIAEQRRLMQGTPARALQTVATRM